MAEQQRKQRKPPKPLKILVNLFAKSGKGGKQRGGNEETGTTRKIFLLNVRHA